MSHGITSRDGLFTVREPAWHGLGQVLSDYPTVEEARAIAHPWEPELETIYRRQVVVDPGNDPGTGEMLHYEYEPVTGFKEVTRSDTHDTLGVVTYTYEPVLNRTLYEIAESIEGADSGRVMLETGGSLHGGRKVWLLLRLRDPIQIGGDPHGATIPYFAIQTSHDGTASLRGQAVLTRIVCDNTANAADLEAGARGTEFVFRHTRNIHDRIEQAKGALAGWRHGIDEYRRLMEHLVTVPVSGVQVEHYLRRFVPSPPAHLQSERVLSNVQAARQQIRDLLKSETTEGTEHTAYGLVQATIEYSQWFRRTKGGTLQARDESRFNRAYLNRSRLVRDAIALVQEV